MKVSPGGKKAWLRDGASLRWIAKKTLVDRHEASEEKDHSDGVWNARTVGERVRETVLFVE